MNLQMSSVGFLFQSNFEGASHKEQLTNARKRKCDALVNFSSYLSKKVERTVCGAGGENRRNVFCRAGEYPGTVRRQFPDLCQRDLSRSRRHGSSPKSSSQVTPPFAAGSHSPDPGADHPTVDPVSSGECEPALLTRCP